MNWIDILFLLGWIWIVIIFGATVASHRKLSKLTVIGIERVDDDEMVFTVNDGKRYRGSGTIWHEYPGARRASTEIESWLSDVWQREQWARAMGNMRRRLSEDEISARLDARGWLGTVRQRLHPYCPVCYEERCRRLWCWFIGAGFDYDPEEHFHWNPNPDRMPGADEFFGKRILPLFIVVGVLGIATWWFLT